jgi:hypothetical protein
MTSKPRVALVPHTRDWSYDFTAQALVQHLGNRFELSVFYSDTLDQLNYRSVDLLVDFWWRSALERRFGARVVKQVSTHRWAQPKYGELTPEDLINGHLRRAGAVIVPSQRLMGELAGAPHLTLGPKGFHPETFGDRGRRRGALAVGWAGNANAVDKRLSVIRDAWPALRVASTLSQQEMPDFYNSIDVITCASDAEGDPRPLIEGMACGCFPVTVDVGIAPELVRHGENGLIVERSAFRDALAWCARNVDYVRARGRENAVEMLRTRTWAACAAKWGDAFEAAVARAPEWKVNGREERKARILVARKKRMRERLEADSAAAAVRPVRSLEELGLVGVDPHAPWPDGFEPSTE